MNTLKQNRLIVYFILSMTVLVAAFLGGCVTARRIDPSTSPGYDGFLRDGATTRREILDHLGPAHAVYENSRILVYHVYLHDGRMNLKKDGTCHACVLVFDRNDVLERHGLVKHGCR